MLKDNSTPDVSDESGNTLKDVLVKVRFLGFLAIAPRMALVHCKQVSYTGTSVVHAVNMIRMTPAKRTSAKLYPEGCKDNVHFIR